MDMSFIRSSLFSAYGHLWSQGQGGSGSNDSGSSSSHPRQDPNAGRHGWAQALRLLGGGTLSSGVLHSRFHSAFNSFKSGSGPAPSLLLAAAVFPTVSLSDSKHGHRSTLPFASLSSALQGQPITNADAGPTRTEPKTGLVFPESIYDGTGSQLLLTGLGVRNKNLFGLKNIKVYAYGLYVSKPDLVAKHKARYGQTTGDALVQSGDFVEDVMKSDTEMTMRLVIFYRGLKIGKVRSAFEESLGKTLQKLTGAEQPTLLHEFTKAFADEVKLERGTIIDISRKGGNVLTTSIDGKQLGRMTSAAMCHAFFDLYLGSEPFDKGAKESMVGTLASFVSS